MKRFHHFKHENGTYWRVRSRPLTFLDAGHLGPRSMYTAVRCGTDGEIAEWLVTASFLGCLRPIFGTQIPVKVLTRLRIALP